MIKVLNIRSGEELSYPLCFLRVVGGDKNDTEAFVRNKSILNGNSLSFPVNDQNFTALVLLSIGHNELEIQCGYHKTILNVKYKPLNITRCVRLLYITCLNEEKFQGPSDMKRDANEAVKRIQCGALLMQTFVAESLSSEGLGKKTFQLEMTKSGLPKVFVIQLPLTIHEAHKFSEQKLWETVAMQILTSPLASRSCKYLAFFCGTRFSNPLNINFQYEKDVLLHTKGHISLGGGGLALVGTGALYSWASNPHEILLKLRNQKEIDKNCLMDFSATRGTWGACYGTHLGSVLHELGHTFDLGHTADGIMSRGFEDFHLYFTSAFIQKKDACCTSTSATTFPKKAGRPSMSSSLIKDPQTFTTNFVRKSIENISMVIEPARDPLASSVVYSPCSTPKATYYESFKISQDNNGNDPTSPGFERYENFCSSQKIQRVDFAPKSPNTISSSFKFFSSPLLQFKSDTSMLSPPNDNERTNFQHWTEIREVKCKAFWARSNAVLLSYHKWLNDTNEEDKPELKGSVLCSSKGIRLIELRDVRMMCFHHWEFLGTNPPPIVHLPWTQVPKWPSEATIEVVAIEDNGGVLKGCSIPRPL